MTSQLFRWLLVGFAALLPLQAHIGSPNIFYEGNAGPYQIRVSIRPPEVVPGRAQINVRVHNGPATTVSALPVRWDAGRKGAPPPDIAQPVVGETNLYSTELWLMDFGAYSVFIDVAGALGKGTAIVPINSVSSQRLPMPRWMAAIFLSAGAILVFLLISVIGAAVRESVLAPSAPDEPKRIRRARMVMAVATVAICLLLWKGNLWWHEVDTDFQNNRLFRPLQVATEIQMRGTNHTIALTIDPTERSWRDHTPLVADHGKLMHLFLVAESDMRAFAHLHPVQVRPNNFESPLPDLPPGEYSIYADVTHESGLTQTLISKVTLGSRPSSSSGADPDNSRWEHSERTQIGSEQNPETHLGSGTVIRSVGSLVANPRTEVTLRFDVLAPDGKPLPLEPYMGMWSHAVVRSKDGSVFTHIHPSGTISMASQELFARRERGEDLKKPIDILCGRPERELIFPYSFPKPGEYRIWVQVKSNGEILTGAFDIQVIPTDS